MLLLRTLRKRIATRERVRRGAWHEKPFWDQGFVVLSLGSQTTD
jgi:hypothetical protein